MKECSFAKEKRKTAAEIDAFFTRLSTPKHIKGSFTPDFVPTSLQSCSCSFLVFLIILDILSVISGKVSKEKIAARVQQMR